MYTNSNNKEINLVIIGKPNSGKSTLFNKLLRDDISPTGKTYGLTKELIIQQYLKCLRNCVNLAGSQF